VGERAAPCAAGTPLCAAGTRLFATYGEAAAGADERQSRSPPAVETQWG